jgi:hypothetical protein
MLFLFSWATTLGQEIDQNLILGKWQFVKATTGPTEIEYKYNGDPLLTFKKNGSWITEDTNPKYRQSGSWKIENNMLIRDPEISGLGDIGPYTRVIDKLTDKELVFYALTAEGERTFTFHFKKLE